MGVGNDPRYQHRSTFLPFPFPDPPNSGRDRFARSPRSWMLIGNNSKPHTPI